MSKYTRGLTFENLWQASLCFSDSLMLALVEAAGVRGGGRGGREGEGGREGGREGGKEGGREGGREGEREGESMQRW